MVSERRRKYLQLESMVESNNEQTHENVVEGTQTSTALLDHNKYNEFVSACGENVKAQTTKASK